MRRARVQGVGRRGGYRAGRLAALGGGCAVLPCSVPPLVVFCCWWWVYGGVIGCGERSGYRVGGLAALRVPVGSRGVVAEVRKGWLVVYPGVREKEARAGGGWCGRCGGRLNSIPRGKTSERGGCDELERYGRGLQCCRGRIQGGTFSRVRSTGRVREKGGKVADTGWGV